MIKKNRPTVMEICSQLNVYNRFKLFNLPYTLALVDPEMNEKTTKRCVCMDKLLIVYNGGPSMAASNLNNDTIL